MRKREWLVELHRREDTIAAMRQEAWTERRLCAERAEAQERFYLDRIREVEDSTRALSLDQLRGMHPTVAMQAFPPEPERRLFVHDSTGLVTTEVDPRDYAADTE